jgi:hypothetical protein
MSENPTNRERSRHVDVRVHFLRDMVRDGSVKLIKCAGTQNVADALTKSLSRPAFHQLCRLTSRKGQPLLLQSPSGLHRWIMFISITTRGERSRPLRLPGESHGLWDRFSSIALQNCKCGSVVTTSTNWIGKNAVLFNRLGAEGTQTSLRLAADALSCAQLHSLRQQLLHCARHDGNNAFKQEVHERG